MRVMVLVKATDDSENGFLPTPEAMVLDVVVRRLNHAADQGHALRQLLGAEGVDLVAVARIGEGQAERTG